MCTYTYTFWISLIVHLLCCCCRCRHWNENNDNSKQFILILASGFEFYCWFSLPRRDFLWPNATWKSNESINYIFIMMKNGSCLWWMRWKLSAKLWLYIARAHYYCLKYYFQRAENWLSCWIVENFVGFAFTWKYYYFCLQGKQKSQIELNWKLRIKNKSRAEQNDNL